MKMQSSENPEFATIGRIVPEGDKYDRRAVLRIHAP
jgi:hypothetical protein